MWLFIKFVLAIILTEAITEIITKSELFNPLRALIFKLGKTSGFKGRLFDWLHSLLDCGYCFSVWAGVLIAFLFLRDLHLIHCSVDWFFVGLVLHRLSNLFHNIMDRIHG